MNILVTGGCGFIGSHFIRHCLLARRSVIQRVVNIDKLTYAGNLRNLAGFERDPRYVFCHGDIVDEARVGQLLGEHQVQAVVHFAAESHVDRSLDNPEPFLHTNVLGTLRLLQAALRHWQHLAARMRRDFRFLHLSTDEVYGALAAAAPPFTETSPCNPSSPYAASKAAGEHLVRAYGVSHGLPVLIVRSANNYGPCQFPEKLIPLMILNALEGRQLPVYGDGQQVRDWLHVGDHVAALEQIMLLGPVGETYNVGGGSEQRNLELVHRLCQLLDLKHPRADGVSYASQIRLVQDRPGHDRRYAVSFAKLQHQLGWVPTTNLDTGLAATIDWYLRHRAWCDEITAHRYQRTRLGILTASS